MEQAGLHEIALHNVLYNGDELAEQFQVDVGTIEFEAEMAPADGTVSIGSIDAVAYVESGEIDLEFTPTLELPDLVATLTGGLATTTYGPFTSFVVDSGGCYSAWCPTIVYEPFMVTEDGATELVLHLIGAANQDPDLFLVYDTDNNGIAEAAYDTVVGSSGNSTGSDEEIVVVSPALGRYFAAIDGYDVDPDTGVNLDWWYSVTAPGDLPVAPADLYSGTVAIMQDALDPATSSFSMTVATTAQVLELNATLTDIPTGSNVDLYLTDDVGAVVASSVLGGDSDESLTYAPPGGGNFADGETYTLWVHGYAVAGGGPIEPTLNFWWQKHSLWLTATHPDVTVSAIGAGEMVDITLHFDQQDWSPGDPDLSARLIAGPSVLSEAFDELITIVREDAPGPPEWDLAYLDVSMSVESARGPSPFAPWTIGGAPVPTALVGASERLTLTARVANMDPTFTSIPLNVDIWPLPEDYLCTYFALCTNQIDGVAYGLIDGPGGTSDYGGGIGWFGAIPSGQAIEISYWVEMSSTMAVGQNHTTGVDVYDIDWNWLDWALGGGYARGFRTTGSYKMSDPSIVVPGDPIDYEFSLMNPSVEDAYVYLVDPLPVEVVFDSATGGAVYWPVTHTVTWEGWLYGSTLETVDFEVEVTTVAGLPDGTLIENEAALFIDPLGDPVGLLYADTLVDDGIEPWLGVYKSVDRLIAMRGYDLVYSVEFWNEGTEDATDVVLTDLIPSTIDVDWSTVTATKESAGALYDMGAGLITWEGDLAIGESVVVTFDATINSTATDELALINMAKVAAANASNEPMNSALTEVWRLFVNHQIFLPIVMK